MSPVQIFPHEWNMTDFPQRLRQLRTARKLTETRGRVAGREPPRVFRWESGDASPF